MCLHTELVAVKMRCPISEISACSTKALKSGVRLESGKLYPVVAFTNSGGMYFSLNVFGVWQTGGYHGNGCSLSGSIPINSLTNKYVLK